jgi:hypothetical protein
MKIRLQKLEDGVFAEIKFPKISLEDEFRAFEV